MVMNFLLLLAIVGCSESLWLPPPHPIKLRSVNVINDLDINLLLQKDLQKIIKALIYDSTRIQGNGPIKVPMYPSKFSFSVTCYYEHFHFYRGNMVCTVSTWKIINFLKF